MDRQKYPEVSQLLVEFADVFHDQLDTSDRLATGELNLKLKEDAVPYMTGRVQKVNYHKISGCMEVLQAHIDRGLLVEHDEAVHRPLKWLFYGQFVEKPNQPGVYRVVGDFGPLNNRIIKDTYDVQTVDQIWKKIDPDSR